MAESIIRKLGSNYLKINSYNVLNKLLDVKKKQRFQLLHLQAVAEMMMIIQHIFQCR